MMIAGLNGNAVAAFKCTPSSASVICTVTPNSCSRNAFASFKDCLLIDRILSQRGDNLRGQAVDECCALLGGIGCILAPLLHGVVLHDLLDHRGAIR